jgi:protein-disulfide isomerase/uncharacterized membrane protein
MEVAKRYGVFIAAGALALLGFGLGAWSIVAWLAAAVLVSLGVVLENPRWGVLVTALVGLGCSAYLFELKLADAGHSACDVSATVSCSVVNSSPASMLFGVPIAVLGAGYFLGLALAAGVSDPSASRLYPTVGATALLGCLFSLYLGWQAYAIGAFCPMCLTIYASNALLVFAALRGAAEREAPLFGELPKVLQSGSALTLAITFAVVGLLGQTVYQSKGHTKGDEVLERLATQQPQPAAPAPVTAPQPAAQPQPAQPAQPRTAADLALDLQQLYAQPRGQLELSDDDPVLGDPKAPYVVVEYACFGCPHCAQAFPHLKELVASDPQVQVRFRSFPLSGECNAAMGRGGRPEVCRAAMAAQCANRQGKFWDFAGLVFANQAQLGDELLASIAQQVGMNFDQFSTCMSDPAILQKVERDAASGARMQIPGTPAMFLKGATGDRWIESCYGAQGIAEIIKDHKAGVTLLEPSMGQCPE